MHDICHTIGPVCAAVKPRSLGRNLPRTLTQRRWLQARPHGRRRRNEQVSICVHDRGAVSIPCFSYPRSAVPGASSNSMLGSVLRRPRCAQSGRNATSHHGAGTTRLNETPPRRSQGGMRLAIRSFDSEVLEQGSSAPVQLPGRGSAKPSRHARLLTACGVAPASRHARIACIRGVREPA